MVSRNLRLSTFGGIYLANGSSILVINFSVSGAVHTTAGLIAFPLQAIPTGSLTLELFTQEKGPVICPHFLNQRKLHRVLLGALPLTAFTPNLRVEQRWSTDFQSLAIPSLGGPQRFKAGKGEKAKYPPLPCKLFTEFSPRISRPCL